MKLETKCLTFGAIPYENIEAVTRMEAKLLEKSPYLPFLPIINPEDTIEKRTLGGIPGVRIRNNKISLRTGSSSYIQGLQRLDRAYTNPVGATLEPFAFESPFIDKFFSLIKKFKSPQAYISLLGPFTISEKLTNIAEEQILADKSFRKLFIQAVSVKALWIINKIREISPNTKPVIILEEPLLGQLGTLKREKEEITSELVTNLIAKVIEKIKAEGAIVAVHCSDKCDWQIPIEAGTDIISFDAYNNPNNLCIIPDTITEFIKKGGKINWCIIPVANESIVKALNIDYVTNRLLSTMDGLILAGVPNKLVYNSALVSNQGNTSHLPIIFAEKTIILTTQLATKIPIVS